MKRPIRLLFIIVSLCACATGWAMDPLLIKFSGVPLAANKNVTMILDNLRSQMQKPITAEAVQNFYQKAPYKIQAAMKPYGYFQVTVSSTITHQHHLWRTHFAISAGKPVRISQLTLRITGPDSQKPLFMRLRKHFPLKVGDILQTEAYEKAKQLLYDLAASHGYFDAKILENKIYINLKTQQARLVFKFQTGKRYFFGYTLFSNTPFSPHFLYKFLSYKKGHHYQYAQIQKTQKALINSHYFNQVVIRPSPKKARFNAVPIWIQLTPAKRYQYTAGLGFGTDTGPRGTLGFTVRRVNAYGHQFNTLLQAAQKNSKLTANYLIPGPNPSTDVFTFSAAYGDFDQVTGNGTSRKLSASYTTAFSKWQQTIALTYLHERYNIVTFPFTKTRVLYPSIHWKYLNTQQTLHPALGFSLSALLAGSLRSSVSDTGFSLMRVNAKFIMTLFENTRIILRSTLARANIKNLKDLPFSLQLFAGGARSVRGYRYNAIGPGRNLFTGSFEIQQRIKGNWYIAAFYDAGNVTENSPVNTKDLFQGVGPGIVWLSPIGTLELTVANAISQPKNPWVIQFTMGPDL